MLACHQLNVRPRPGARPLVRGATARFASGGLHALIGPSGCGKTTLLKGLLGILPAEGEIFLRGRRVAGPDALLREVAFAPQFSIAHGKLTVGESLACALELYQGRSGADGAALLRLVGLEDRRDTLVEKLSGGQLRRLGLALELTTDPACLLCDEVTSGLDPRSEDQILAVLRALVAEQGRTVVCVIHNLAKLPQFDSITVVYEGTVVFQGALSAMLAHFDLTDALTLYDRLAEKPLTEWQAAWAEKAPPHAGEPVIVSSPAIISLPPSEHRPRLEPPPVMAQVRTLLARRWRLLLRDRGYLWLTLAITFGFPCLVVIFALRGLPQLHTLSLESDGGRIQTLMDHANFVREQIKTGTLVSGLIIFQVILLCLMGSNNGAREIAGERALYEKERMSGLRPAAYAWAKLAFAALLGAAQGAWMTVFVKSICEFPGAWGPQLLVLGGTCAAMSVVCLGLSAQMTSADRASLLSIYLVGFQLPLSGVVLALPTAIAWLVRPLILTYWGWVGYLKPMGDATNPAFYLAVTKMGEDKDWWLWQPAGALAVLGAHLILGAVLVFSGCKSKRWP
jgi:ABC-type multidrug transport system ATPase subunit